jgi:hypothetical protein
LRIGNHYFSPDSEAEVIPEYFRFLENSLYTYNFHVLLLGAFYALGFDWEYGLPRLNCHCYSEHNGDAIYTSTSSGCLDAADSSNLT